MIARTSGAELDDDIRALDVLREGLRTSPELRPGVVFTILMALLSAAGRLIVPIAIQITLDRGVDTPQGFRPTFVYVSCGLTVGVILIVFFASRITYWRLVNASELMLRNLRVRVFEHIHKLSLAEHTGTRKGELTARVTSDVETIARFAQWGAISWVVNGALILGTLIVMLVYSWQLTLVVVAVYLPLLPLLRWMQKRQLVAYGRVRSSVGATLTATSEAVMGSGVVRAYGYQDRTRGRLEEAITHQYKSQVRAHRFFAVVLPTADVFGAAALASVVAAGVWWGPGWGLTSGEVIAYLFLVNLVLNPIAELGEVLDQTQTALAGWWKVLRVLDIEPDVVEPTDGRKLPDGPLSVEVDGVAFSYRTGGRVLHGIDLEIPAETSVAVVGETGSGKTTLAKLLARMADPTEGEVRIGGVPLTDVAPEARRHGIRMVPQDGFLFATTVRENVRMGHAGATDAEVEDAFTSLDLDWWVDRLPDGLDTHVGERGESLSVGERQLVALARAQLADPGLLILDEATSAVDPETEQALNHALERLSAGRTTISVAHRLSTAERADLVVVFDAGRIVEIGPHDDLVRAGGIYASLFDSWLGNTRDAA